MRKKSVSKNLKQGEKKGISADILLLLFGLTAIFFLLSLVSYSIDDPAYSTIIFSKYNDADINNLFGKTGAFAADYLGMVFGWAALFIPFIFIYISVLLYRYKRGRIFMTAPIACFIYGICIVMCFSVLSGLIGGSDFYFTAQPAGGALGVIGSKIILSVMGKVGGIIVFLCLITAFAMLLFSVSFSDMGAGFRFIFAKIKGLGALFSDKSEKNDTACKEEIAGSGDDDIEEEGFFENVKNKLSSFFQPKARAPIATLPAGREENKAESLLNSEELKAISDIPFHKSDDHIIDLEPEEYTEEDNAPVVCEPVIKEPYEAVKPEVSYQEDETISDETDSGVETAEIRDMEETRQDKTVSYEIPFSILKDVPKDIVTDSADDMKSQGDILVKKLKDFNVSGVVRAIQPGPVVTMFEFEPASGTRVAKIAALENDLALSMSALSIRIIAPIPGKNAVGIEIPNKNRASVFIKELLQTPEFAGSESPLTVALGKDAAGKPYMSDIRKMPHLLVAGTTGSGKSVGINTMICSILYKSSPDEVKFIMIDPKMVELSIYDGIPHLLAPVVTDTRLASSVLKNVVTEMTRRYSLLAEKKVRNIDGYNDIIAGDETAEKMPYLVVVVDEFADLMMVSGKDVEISIARIAQMARAVGIHLIVATQRPTTNVITGLIKANMPARLAFKVSQKNDSRVILDQNGADTLLGMGDSLFIPPGTSEPLRIHGAFVSDDEVRNIVEYLQSSYGAPEYNMDILKEVKEDGASGGDDDDEEDSLYQNALDIVYEKGVASISMVQRNLKIGYNRAARIVEMMEKRGVIAPSDGTAKPREVIRR